MDMDEPVKVLQVLIQLGPTRFGSADGLRPTRKVDKAAFQPFQGLRCAQGMHLMAVGRLSS